jgi:hypothetical protein
LKFKMSIPEGGVPIPMLASAAPEKVAEKRIADLEMKKSNLVQKRGYVLLATGEVNKKMLELEKTQVALSLMDRNVLADLEALDKEIAEYKEQKADASALFHTLDSSVQAKVLPQVSIANEAQEWDYNMEETEEAEDSINTLRQGNDFRQTIENFSHNAHVPVLESQLPSNKNINMLPSLSRRNTIPLNISLENRLADHSTGRDGRGELQGVGQFQPTSPSQIQTGGKVFQQRSEQQDSHTPDLFQHYQEEPWEEVLVTNHTNLSQTNPAQLRVDAFQLSNVIQPSQGNLSASPNSKLGSMIDLLGHPEEHEPPNSALAGSLSGLPVPWLW